MNLITVVVFRKKTCYCVLSSYEISIMMLTLIHLLEDVKSFSVLNLVYVSVRALNTGNSQYFMSFITESLSKIILLLIYIVYMYFFLFVYLNCLQLQVNFKVKILQNTVYFITKYSIDFLKYFNG